MNCKKCGAPIADGVKFCPECGALQDAPGTPLAAAPTAEAGGAAASQTGVSPRVGIPAPGFSDRINHPDVLKAAKKNRKATLIFAAVMVPLPLLGFLIFSLFSDKMETKTALIIGGIVSAVFLVFALWSFIRLLTEKEYEATVIGKKSVETTVRDNGQESRTVTEFITTVKTVSGKKKKIREREGPNVMAYNYLNVGDTFRYHPQFAFPYELYDKSKAPYIACVKCGKKNPVAEDRCSKCGLILLK